MHHCFHRKQWVMVLFKISENQKILATDMKKKETKKRLKDRYIYADPSLWEQLWDWKKHDKSCLLQNLHVLLHAILSQRGIWTYITVWLCFSNVLIKLKDIFHLLRHKTKIIFSWLMQTTIFLFLLMQSRYICCL